MSFLRAYRIPVEAYRGDSVESRHTVYVATCNADASLEYQCDIADLPDIWMRSTAKPFQLLPLLLEQAGRASLHDPPDIAVSVASHDGTEKHAARVQAILERAGLGAQLLRCGVQRPYFLQHHPANAPEHAQRFTELHNNCSGNHVAMLQWARLQGVPLESYLDATNPAQQVIHQVIAAVAGSTPQIATDNCGAPCYRLPLQNVALSYLSLANTAAPNTAADAAARKTYEADHRERLAVLGPVDMVQRQLNAIGAAMASHPSWVSGEKTEATVLAQHFSGALVIKHGAEGVLCVVHREKKASLALKVMDGNGRALFPVLLRLMRAFGWLDDVAAGQMTSLVQPPLRGLAGHLVGELRVVRGENAVSK